MNVSEGNQLELLDIYDVWYNPWWHQTWFIVASSLILVGFIFLGFYFIYKKFFVSIVIKQPWQKLLDELKILSTSDFDDQKKFYSRLTSALKQYIQESYSLQLVDKTDTEFIDALEYCPTIPAHVTQELKTIFDGVMLIKFAHQKTVHEHMSSSLKAAEALVKEIRDQK